MARFNLFIDTDRGQPVISDQDATLAELPAFVQGDTLALRIVLLTGYSRAATYTKIPVSGLTLQVALGARTGNATTYYTQQFTWTASADLANPYWEASLPMNTEAITGRLGSGASASAWLEVKVLESGSPRTVLSKEVTIQAAVIKDGGVVVPAGLTPLSAEAANVMFPRKSGDRIQLTRDGVVVAEMYWGEDNAFHVDPVI